MTIFHVQLGTIEVVGELPIEWLRSPNGGGAIEPRFLCMHYTAGRGFEQSIAWLRSPRSKASAHFVVGRQGQVAQLVELDRRAWHAGASTWRGLQGMNRYSIGVELDNPGPLRKTPGGWQTWWGGAWDEDDVVLARHKHGGPERGWASYSEEQIVAAYVLCESLIDALPRIEDVIGHEDVAPSRKTDPGPAWPMDAFRTWLFGRESDDAPLTVIPSSS